MNQPKPSIRVADSSLVAPTFVGARTDFFGDLFSLEFITPDSTGEADFAIVQKVFLTDDAVKGVLNALNDTYNQWLLNRPQD